MQRCRRSCSEVGARNVVEELNLDIDVEVNWSLRRLLDAFFRKGRKGRVKVVTLDV